MHNFLWDKLLYNVFFRNINNLSFSIDLFKNYLIKKYNNRLRKKYYNQYRKNKENCMFIIVFLLIYLKVN